GPLEEGVLVHRRLVVAALLAAQPALELRGADAQPLADRVGEGEALLVALLDVLQVDEVVQLRLGEVEQALEAGAVVGLELLAARRAAAQHAAGELAAGEDDALLGVEAAEVGLAEELAVAELGPAGEARLPEADAALQPAVAHQEPAAALGVVAAEPA